MQFLPNRTSTKACQKNKQQFFAQKLLEVIIYKQNNYYGWVIQREVSYKTRGNWSWSTYIKSIFDNCWSVLKYNSDSTKSVLDEKAGPHNPKHREAFLAETGLHYFTVARKMLRFRDIPLRLLWQKAYSFTSHTCSDHFFIKKNKTLLIPFLNSLE